MKYDYNYVPTQEEINNAWEILSKVGRPEVSFNIYNEDSELDRISELIRSMGSFNAKDAQKVSSEFKKFFKSLPRVQYADGNPNNGRALFDEIILHGDDYIVLNARGFKKYMDIHDWKAVRQLVEEKGSRWKADVASLEYVERDLGLVSYEIKFWWD